MDIRTYGKVIRRVAMAAGFALALSSCGMAVEQPPRAMFGTASWSDGWQVACHNVYPPDARPQQIGFEHIDRDCQQYQVAQQRREQYLAAQHLREQKPYVAANDVH